ncbi:MAG: hypothetical protein E7391_05245 [Ruminococcaceae bacterium]|nr:hypothetical protein [Oscillospiraceae bacterium]
MKKLLCFLVVLSMVLTVFSITSFATTVEKTVWTQGFEADADVGLNNCKAGTYANGARYHANGSAWTKQTGIKTEGNNSYFYATHFNANYGGRYKVYLDQSAFEAGETFKVVATVKYIVNDTSYESTFPTLPLTMGMTDSTGIDHSGTVATDTKIDYTMNLNETKTIETETFVYNKSNYADEEINLYFSFSGTSSGNGIKAIIVDDVKIVKISDETIFNTSADAGYYEEGDGVIAFNAETLYGKDDVTAYGMYIYRNDLGESEKVELKSADISVFKANDGQFFATVTNVPAEYFGEKVACKPYIVIDGKTIFGEVLTYSVNDGNKYLGAKGE